MFACFQGVRTVKETWKNMKFILQPNLKSNQQRSLVLGAVDEILLNATNDKMDLQSMAGSRYVGSFLGTIQQLEKDLSLINETIEVRQHSQSPDSRS